MELFNYARICRFPTKSEPAGEEETELQTPLQQLKR